MSEIGRTMVTKSTTPEQTGNPANISLRVCDIQPVLQLRGFFKIGMPDFGGLAAVLRDPKVQASVDDEGVNVVISFKFEGHNVPSDGDPKVSSEESGEVFRAEATYAVHYELDSTEAIDTADLEAFGYVNGMLTLWPYWREFVQQCLSRTGLPSLALPPFNPARMLKKAETAESG